MDMVVEQYKIAEIYYLENLEQLEAFCSKIRYRLINQLGQGPKNSAQLAREIAISRPKAHYHLQVLVRMGLICLAGEKLVNGIMEKYYIGKAHFYSYDELFQYSADHPEDTEFNKRFQQARHDFLLCMLDVSRDRISRSEGKQEPAGDSFLFDFGCHLTDEQAAQVIERLDELSVMIRAFHAENSRRPDYLDLTGYKSMLLLLPVLPDTNLLTDDILKSN
jgi:hypothetical protein